MAQFIVQFDTDNAAFEHPGEVSRILHDIAEKIEPLTAAELAAAPIFDANGNRVGRWTHYL